MESRNPTMEEPSVSSMFQNIAAAPDIPVYAVMVAYSKDPSPEKLNLGIGVYRTEDGKPHVLCVVKKAEQILVNDLSACKEYLPITGLPKFTRLSAELLFGNDSLAIKECRVTTVQCLSGSGALRIGADFLAKHYPKENKTVYLPQPTYANHPNFFLAAGLALRTYRYYCKKAHQLDFKGNVGILLGRTKKEYVGYLLGRREYKIGLLEDLGSAPSGAIVLLQASGHNPSGADPTSQQWEQIRKLIRTKALLPFFDCAYQGMVSGDLDSDAQSVRMFASDGGECLVAQSFSKTMGLYAERIGALSMVCKTSDVASRVESQLKPLIRPMYSNPPIHGAAIVSLILNNRNMFSEWTAELKAMTDRLTRVRQQLYDALERKGTPGSWSHITRQVGMFSLLGLSEEQVAFMTKEFHIYMSSDGRVNMAGLSLKTVPYLAEAIHAAVARMA